MNNTHEPKIAAIKLLAIVGFFAMLALIVWAAVQGLRAFPHAFSSLATIAESIQEYGNEKELGITLEKNIVNSGEVFKLTWTEMHGEGTYHFTYTCADGVGLSVRTDTGALQEISCTEDLELPKGANGLFVSATAEAQRFSDLTVSVRFDAKKGDDHITQSRVTLVNATVPTHVAELPPTPEVVAVVNPPVVAKPPVVVATPPAVTPKPAPQPASTIVSMVPQSNPNGFTDLKMSFVGVGEIKGTTFTPIASFDNDTRGSIRFDVKNIGTKRSDTWTYSVMLPEGRYESEIQTPLEPNERAIYTISFDFSETVTKSFTFKGTTVAKSDTNLKNNEFSWSVKVTE